MRRLLAISLSCMSPLSTFNVMQNTTSAKKIKSVRFMLLLKIWPCRDVQGVRIVLRNTTSAKNIGKVKVKIEDSSSCNEFVFD